ncbi:hypothetical protein BN1723_013233 [Verticillium longisporum]|uniref:Cytochrome c oxidase assembly protein COX20, mitochondrial n=1 Tax=Verticillium longisporum TaxID=100787 RepID=A0A0G4LQM4_VERLO|nr:hypothetical protein BN1723_013233 [Verticillium longisporum]
MSSNQNHTETHQEAKKGWLWSRGAPSNEPAETSAPSSSPETAIDPRLDLSRAPPKELPKLVNAKLDPADFKTNFPPQQGEGPTVGDAVKTIKPEDFLVVSQAPCARDGYIAGIVSGGLVGGIKFVMKAPIPKVANWAVGSTLAGAAASYEYLYHEAMADKHKKEAEARREARDEAARAKQAAAEAARQDPWYKFW